MAGAFEASRPFVVSSCSIAGAAGYNAAVSHGCARAAALSEVSGSDRKPYRPLFGRSAMLHAGIYNAL